MPSDDLSMARSNFLEDAAAAVEKLSTSNLLTELPMHLDDVHGDVICACTSNSIADDAECVYCTEVFSSPPPPQECLLCCHPLVYEGQGPTYATCCSNSFCNSCMWREMQTRNETDGARVMRGKEELPYRCPFCRALATVPKDEEIARFQKHLDANDPEAYCRLAEDHLWNSDFDLSLESFVRAAELGCTRTLNSVGRILSIFASPDLLGGTSLPDTDKLLDLQKKFLLIGAMKGDIPCHNSLGDAYMEDGDPIKAYKHYCFAASHGCTESSKVLLQGYTRGYVSKEMYLTTLRAYKAAYDDIMTLDRRNTQKMRHDYMTQCEVPQSMEQLEKKWGFEPGASKEARIINIGA